ncbi:MAG: chorismate synthase [bacterium]
MEFVSAGESHGAALVAILSGFPAGLKFDNALFKAELIRRKSSSGGSKRLEFEEDEVKVLSGMSDNLTTGAPISFLVENSLKGVQLFENRVKRKGFPRPGHVDCCSYIKFGHNDFSTGPERSSARETVLRVAAGSFCKMLLHEFNIEIFSEVLEIGGIEFKSFDLKKQSADTEQGSYGGTLKVTASGVPAGLGSNSQWFNKLDALLSMAFFSIPSVKGVYFGDNSLHKKRGMGCIDHFTGKGTERKSNLAGGIEGGISNGCPIYATLYFKPIPTQPVEFEAPLPFSGGQGAFGGGMNDLWCVERAAVIAESMMAFVVARAFCEKFGKDCLGDIKVSYDSYCERIK